MVRRSPTCMTRLLGLEWYEWRLMKNEYPLFGAYLRGQVQVRRCQVQSKDVIFRVVHADRMLGSSRRRLSSGWCRMLGWVAGGWMGGGGLHWYTMSKHSAVDNGGPGGLAYMNFAKQSPSSSFRTSRRAAQKGTHQHRVHVRVRYSTLTA